MVRKNPLQDVASLLIVIKVVTAGMLAGSLEDQEEENITEIIKEIIIDPNEND